MEENVGVPRTANDAEGLSVVTSLGEVSEQITITEELPNEHDSNQQYEQNPSESASNAVQQCEVQVVKVANVGGGMNITFSTPALITRSEEDGGQTHTIQVAESALAPIQEVAIASPENSNRSDTPIQGDCDIHEEQDQESLHIQEGSSPEPSHRRDDNHKSTSWDAVINAEVLSVRCRNETAELHKSKLGSGGRGKCIKNLEQIEVNTYLKISLSNGQLSFCYPSLFFPSYLFTPPPSLLKLLKLQAPKT
ncbi:predicted protein [Nematostella vectensis]|uniref:SAND domain-containing protein n=1 Tax=Nematostella vectensis TaxID=45351 RepID=A7SVR7_NEMVE|nr:predicted protein [Nematostella vectensis]|eukprot:XP_001624296.1 predicted protein [Nematostella vectensis]